MPPIHGVGSGLGLGQYIDLFSVYNKFRPIERNIRLLLDHLGKSNSLSTGVAKLVRMKSGAMDDETDNSWKNFIDRDPGHKFLTWYNEFLGQFMSGGTRHPRGLFTYSQIPLMVQARLRLLCSL